jgi:hypothetical protein
MQASTHITHSTPARARSFVSGVVCLVVPLLLAGCGDSEIVAYRVPKEAPAAPRDSVHAQAHAPGAASAPSSMPPAAAPADSASMANTAVATASGPSLAWSAPSAWQPKAGSAMRKGSYAVVGEGGAAADLAITAFPGDVGGEIANVNRWRGQVGLGSLADAEAAAALTRLDVNGLKIAVVECAPAETGGARLLGAMIPFSGSTWFFKLLGPDAVVAGAKPAFLEFLKTIKPSAPEAAGPVANPTP